MRKGRAEALRAAVAERLRGDAEFRVAYADLRETCAFALDPRHADRDLARLMARYLDADGRDTPVSARFEAVVSRLHPKGVSEGRAEYDPNPSIWKSTPSRGTNSPDPSTQPLSPGGERGFLADGVATLLRDHLRLELGAVAALDPWAGGGDIATALKARKVYANEADPLRYAALARVVGSGAVLGDSLRLPERRPTPGFDFCEDENIGRVDEEQATDFAVIASDLRRQGERGLQTRLEWTIRRLAPRGVIAFLSDENWIDEPAFSPLRTILEREFGSVVHLALWDGTGLSFLVRGGGDPKKILYAEADEMPESFASVEWRELQPTATHVWRTEILHEEWAGFLPLAGERGSVFSQAHPGMPDGTDSPVPAAKARRVLRCPFSSAWRVLDRKARRESVPVEAPSIVLIGEPFGVLGTDAPIDRRLGARAVGGPPTAETMRRFRAAYGAAVTERDVFDATLALLHHPEYAVRYREDLRRGMPRLPLPDAEALEGLLDAPGAPPVGPGTAFRTGWLSEAAFETGTVPDFDDPFASPYARADVEPAFLLLVGLGAALYRVQVDFERLRPFSLEQEGEPGRVERMRFTKDRTRLILRPGWTLDGVPPEAFEWTVGKRGAPEWIVEGFRVRAGFDPNRPDEPERPARLFAQAVAASLETRRLASIVGAVAL